MEKTPHLFPFLSTLMAFVFMKTTRRRPQTKSNSSYAKKTETTATKTKKLNKKHYTVKWKKFYFFTSVCKVFVVCFGFVWAAFGQTWLLLWHLFGPNELCLHFPPFPTRKEKVS